MKNLLKILLKSLLVCYVLAQHQICKYVLLDKCKLNKYTLFGQSNSECVCHGLKINLTLTNQTFHTLKKFNSWQIDIFFKLTKNTIIDQNLQLNTGSFKIPTTYSLIKFLFVKGFEINAFPKPLISFDSFYFIFFESSLSFYSNGHALKTCQNLKHPRSLFQALNGTKYLSLSFVNSKFTQLCPLVFSNVRISILNINWLSNTFYKTNILSFFELPGRLSINSSILAFELSCEKITLNHRILNQHVFNQTKELRLTGEIISIDSGTFRSMPNLKYLEIELDIWHRLVQIGGIDWILDLNSNIKVNLNESLNLKAFFSNFSFVIINAIMRPYKKTQGIAVPKMKEVLPDEDFCVYVKFPFEQLVIAIHEEFLINKNIDKTCTFIWIIQYLPIYPKYFYFQYIMNFLPIDGKEIRRLVSECNFIER